MLEIVAELESAGKHLQHFSRELARFFRNLLVSRIAGKTTRLIAASPEEQDRLREIAGRFSEEDLTRWLQLTLEIYQQLQYSLQPRLHLELGLLRLVHAGRIKPIEEMLKELGGQAPPAAKTPPPARTPPPPSPPPARSVAPSPAPVPAGGGPTAPAAGPLKERLMSASNRLAGPR
jgi:DNA polymerase-3 subunit gamma/tau